ncbi:hypothetical protein AB0K52_20365 [Glycomyces sp. NPDC049804]|uniref:hypothetical protein n=1 Tax=Glycomyces sp. NPDC049804 TaxID=3154363 RepID=UPI00342230AB
MVVDGGDGFLRFTFNVEGRVDKFEFAPRIMRVGSEILFGEIKSMVNAALDERAEATGTDEPVPDLEAITESAAEIQDYFLRQFQAMSASISEVMANSEPDPCQPQRRVADHEQSEAPA